MAVLGLCAVITRPVRAFGFLVLSAVVAPACAAATRSERSCGDAGRAMLDNTCVSQQVADFVMCIRSRGDVQLKDDRGQHLEIAAKIAGQEASTAIDARNRLDASYQAKAGADAERQIIAACSTVVDTLARAQPSQDLAATPTAAGPSR